MIHQATVEVSVASIEVIVKDVPAVRAETPTPVGLRMVPSDCGVSKILELADTAVVETTTVPPTKVAKPIFELAPSFTPTVFPAVVMETASENAPVVADSASMDSGPTPVSPALLI